MNTDLLTRLAEAGTPMHLIAEVATELARAEVAQEAIEKRREADRERQSRRRNNVTSRDTADVTGEPALSLPPNEKISNPPTHTHPDNNNTRAKGDPFPRPEWAEPQPWRDFLANRKTKKLTNTATAHEKFLRDVERESARTGWPPGEVLKRCAARGWGGIHEITEQNNDRQQNRNSSRPSSIDAMRRAIELTGGPEISGAAEPGAVDRGTDPMPDALRAIGHAQR